MKEYPAARSGGKDSALQNSGYSSSHALSSTSDSRAVNYINSHYFMLTPLRNDIFVGVILSRLEEFILRSLEFLQQRGL